jgi:hypothetical protein
LPLAYGDRLRQPQQVARRQRPGHEAARPGASERRFEGHGELLVQLDVHAGHLAQLQRHAELDASAYHALRHEGAHVALHQRHRLRHSELKVEVAVIERADRHRNRRPIVLDRRRRKAGHASNQDGTIRRSAFRDSRSCN